MLTHGIDISSYQGAPDWAAVGADPQNFKFCFIKATEGTGYKANYTPQWAGAGSVDLLCSNYHFYRQAASPSYQASYFCNWASKGELPPVLDFEDVDGLKAYGGKAMFEGAKVWLSEVTRLWGVKPIVYTGQWYLQMCWNSAPTYDSRWLANYPLWIANYTGSPDVEPLRPSWWPWTFYQWTSSGQVSGISGRVDLDVFDGDYNALRVWAGLEPVTTEPTDAEKLALLWQAHPELWSK